VEVTMRRPPGPAHSVLLLLRSVLLGGTVLAERPPHYWEFHERGFEQALQMGKS
jgi:hypothetical protein